MRPKQQTTTQSGDLFPGTLEQIINMKRAILLATVVLNTIQR